LVTEDRVNREIHGGAILDLTGLGLKVTGNLALRQSPAGEIKNDWAPFLGLEKSLAQNRLALRAGANDLEYTAGLGVRLGALGFDYAFAFNKNLSSNNTGSHKLGMTYRFMGRP
jgi:hypothetical protein